MSAFWYGVLLQWKLDIRSKSMLITCYVVPLLFFAFMGGIFTSINPEARDTLIQSMTVMGVSMGALVGLPQSLAEIYGGGIKRIYKVNGVPISFGAATLFLSALIHLLLMAVILYIAAPIVFGATPPADPPLFFAALAIFIAVSLGIGSVLGLSVKNQEKLTMVSQLVFLPSIMLSGIMFPVRMLPHLFETIGNIFPAAWGYRLMTGGGFVPANLLPLAAIFAAATALCCLLLKNLHRE